MPTVTAPVLDDDPFDPATLTDPYAFHARLRDAGPVVRLARYGIWASGRHEHVRACLSDWETYCSGAGVGLSDFRKEPPWRPPSLLLETDPPLHDAVRPLVNRILSPRAMRDLRAAFAPAADGLVAALVARGTFDAVTDLAEPYPLRVFPDAVGVPADGREHLLPYGTMAFNAFGPRNDLFRAAFVDAERVQTWIAAACERGNLTADGFGAAIWAAADAGEISAEQAPLLIRSLLTAGIDTTVHGLGITLHALATHPEQYAALRRRPGLARLAFEEGLRWDAPVQTFFRTTTRDVRIGGVPVPAGEKILLCLGAANRDPRRWGPGADRYDIHRRTGGHVAFGAGIHNCVGQAVARLEGELILAALSRHAAHLTPASPAIPRPNNTLKGYAHVPVRVPPS